MQRQQVVRTIQIAVGAIAVAALLTFGLTASQTDGPTPPATAPSTPPATQSQRPIETVTIGGEQFKLELSADNATRARGLMGRTSIPDHGGMIFVHPYAQVQAYWMANCLTDMDIMYLDPQGRIVATYTMKVEPPRRADESQYDYERRMKSYSSGKPAQFVIELKAGTIERLKLKPGMEISLDLARLKRLAK